MPNWDMLSKLDGAQLRNKYVENWRFIKNRPPLIRMSRRAEDRFWDA